MKISSDLFLAKLTAFAEYLRKQGMQIGLNEVTDCMRALAFTGFEDRETVKSVLSSLCAKTPREMQVFSQCFDVFFVSQEEFENNLAAEREAERLYEEQREKAEQELQFNGKPIDLREDMKDVYARMPQEERDRLQKLAERYSDNVSRSANLYEGFIKSVFMRSIMEQQMLMEDAGEGSAGASSEADLMYRDISAFRAEEIPKAYQLIDNITRRINGETAARKRTIGRDAALDFKKTIRAGLSSGGVMTKLHHKHKHNRKKRVILLCDVSGSMLQFSEFAIRFIKSMTDISDHSQTFLFSESVQKVSPFALENMNAFGHYVRHSGVWGKGTNIGRALDYINGMQPQILGPGAVLIILSDAKTVDMPRAEQALQRAGKLAGSVIWLNPIPANKWPYLRGITLLKEYCQMVPCSTLNELARACARLT